MKEQYDEIITKTSSNIRRVFMQCNLMKIKSIKITARTYSTVAE